MLNRFLPSFLTLLALALPAHAADAPAPDPAEAKVRALLSTRIAGDALVFSNDLDPASLRLEPAEAVKNLSLALKTTVRDQHGAIQTTFDKPGPYAALTSITWPEPLLPGGALDTQRFTTLYRLASPIAADRAFATEADLPDLAKAAGIEPAAMLRQATLVLATLKGRAWKDAAKDSQVARLLAGLALTPAGRGEVRRNEDAFAQERQWWVGIRRPLDGYDKRFPKPFVAPVQIKGFDAPMVREGTPAEAGVKPDTADKIDAALNEWAADTDQAFAVCVVRRGVIVHHKAYGQRDGKPMTLTTKSWMASVTKTMSATLMMMLIDQVRLDLDDPIDRFVPLAPVKVEKPLTIRHLYTHTNGLNAWPGFSDELADVQHLVRDLYPAVKVGKEWAYNGLGYTLGGKIIENISGEAVPLFYVKHLLGPLGMTNTDVLATHADARSVPLDMAKFGQMLLNKGDYGTLRFMRPETFDSMLPQRLAATLGPDAKKTFGIGLDGAPGSGKFGHGAASAATFHVNQKDQLVVIMTRNAIGRNYDKYNGKFWKAIEDGILRE